MRRTWLLTTLVVVGAGAAIGGLSAGFRGIVAQEASGQEASGPADTAGVSPMAPAPAQPIPFPHDRHAGEFEIDCQYCHYAAERSVDAGIPSVATCMGCHRLVATDSAGVQKLAEYASAGEPIPWVRIYKVADHVTFPHMRHVSAAVECQECHGPVEEMTEIRLAQPLDMGWCVSCHEDNDARTDCAVCHY